MMMRLLTAAFFVFAFGVVHSQVPLSSATPEELVEKLNPNVKTRSLRNLTPEQREKPNIDLVIQFEFGSAKLLPQSKPLLDSLAKAMNSSQLRGYAFLVTGYTDSVGTPEYNLRLSDQRASSVVSYLTGMEVKKDRLKSIGKGSTDLLVPDKPDAPENRRVKITLDS